MKKQTVKTLFALALLIGCSALWSSCTKLGKNLRFNLPMQTGTVNLVIPATNTTGTATFGPTMNTFNVDSFIKANTANQLGIDNIYSVKIASCTITINNATADNNFANFSSCSASFSSDKQSQPYTLNITNNPDIYSNILVMPVDTAQDLSSYLGNKFYYSVSGTLRRATTISLNCTVSYAFNIIVQG